MKVWQFGFVVNENDFLKKLRRRSVYDRIDGTKQSAPPFVVKNKDHGGLGQVRGVVPVLAFLFSHVRNRPVQGDRVRDELVEAVDTFELLFLSGLAGTQPVAFTVLSGAVARRDFDTGRRLKVAGVSGALEVGFDSGMRDQGAFLGRGKDVRVITVAGMEGEVFQGCAYRLRVVVVPDDENEDDEAGKKGQGQLKHPRPAKLYHIHGFFKFAAAVFQQNLNLPDPPALSNHAVGRRSRLVDVIF